MKHLIVTLMLVLLSLPVLAAEWTQYYFRFQVNDRSELHTLTDVISIDNVQGNTVYAYANDNEWEAFQRLGYEAEILPSPASQFTPIMRDVGQTTRDWDYYPTYDAYVAMMYAFQTNYPTLCQIIDAGTTVGGRKILFAKISDNISVHEAEPEVQYVSTMHGDETVGYILMLRLIDYLLSNYATDTRVQNLVNNLEIWINPNHNPDGTYYGGNDTVSGARRYNLNGIDLNRSYYPDPWGGYTQTHQVENTIMENLAYDHHYVLSCNFHGGAEVVNYPWDGIPTLHLDNNWYVDISTDYVNSVHSVSPSTYMDDLNNGITNGYAWYETHGGKQDWYTYWVQCREVIIELSSTKLPAASTLPTYWNYNYDAMLGFLENALYGLQGIVTDAYGNPLDATINIVGLDDDHSRATTDPAHGDYVRMLMPGTYTVEISVDGYDTQTFTNVVIYDHQKTTLNAVFGAAQDTQVIPLAAGWNLISLNVIPAEPGVQSVLGDIMGSVLQIKNEESTYAPEVADYFNTLDELSVSDGYWLNVNTGTTLSVTGTAVDPATSIDLNSGWNLVSYLPADAMTVSTALASVSAYLQEVRSATQFYIPGGGSNTLSSMAPNNGYWVKVSQACTLTYPSARK
jgi:hypothetical protein